MNHFEYLMLYHKGLKEFAKDFGNRATSYEEVYLKLRKEMPYFDPKELATPAVMLFHGINMLAMGSKIYKINESLHLVMMNTDPKNLTAEQIKIPFHEFFIETPDTNWYNDEFKIYYNGEWQQASGFYVSALHDHTHFNNILGCEQTDYLFLRIMVVGQIKKAWEESNFYFFNLSFKNKDTTVEQAIHELISQWSNKEIREKYSNNTDQNNLEFTKQLFNYVLNIIMYVTAKNNDVQYVKSNFDVSKNADSMVRKIKKYKHKDVLGKHYIYLPRESMAVINKNPGARQGIGLDKTVFVSGFWRWQACGPKWSEHRLTWIAPHQRGDGEISQTTYIVKEKENG